MDNLTHSLVGIALSRAFFKDKAPLATTMLIVAANAPDVDVLWSMRGIRYIEYHRGFTHSLLFLPLGMLLIAWLWRGLAGRLQRRKGNWDPAQGRWRPRGEAEEGQRKNPVSWRLGLAAGLLGIGSHLLMDWTNSYGIRLLDPLSQHWFALDWMPIVDPWLWLILLACLNLPMLLAMVQRDQGGPRGHYRKSAAVALLAMGAWWGVRAAAHQRALEKLRQALDEPAANRALAAYPTFTSPLTWRGVASLPDRYQIGNITAGNGKPPRLHNLYKPVATPAILAAEHTRAARIFLQFARDPWVKTRPGAGNTKVVMISDLRFGTPKSFHGMGVRVRLQHNLRPMSEQFRF